MGKLVYTNETDQCNKIPFPIYDFKTPKHHIKN